MPHQHSIYDSDAHFTINSITKEISSAFNKKIVQGDHNSERLTFELSRHIEGHDMSLSDKIEIHYINVAANKTNQSKDVYLVADAQVSPDSDEVLIFSWLVSGNATQYAGTLNFLIRFTCLTGETIDYVWNTAIYSGITIDSGMNNGEAVVQEYSDVLEAWKAEILGGSIEAAARAEEAAARAEEVVAREGEAAERAESAATRAEEAAERAEEAGSGLPVVSAADNGKVLVVEGGVWAAVAVTNAEEVSV